MAAFAPRSLLSLNTKPEQDSSPVHSQTGRNGDSAHQRVSFFGKLRLFLCGQITISVRDRADRTASSGFSGGALRRSS